MPNERISIEKLKHLIQLLGNKLTTRAAARALNMSQGAVCKYSSAVRAAGIEWEEAQKLEDAELERRIWQAPNMSAPRNAVLPDCAWIHTELKRHKHVTLQLLWDEYQAIHRQLALRYSAFCERYRQWARRLKRSMRQRLRVRRGHPHCEPSGLAREPRADAGILRRIAHDFGAGQPAGRRDESGPLRAGAAAFVRGNGRAF
jgi:hypothetical protein